MNLPHPQPGQKATLGKQQGPWSVVVGSSPASRSRASSVRSPEQLHFDPRETRAKGWRPGPCLRLSCQAERHPTIMPTCTVPELCS